MKAIAEKENELKKEESAKELMGESKKKQDALVRETDEQK